MVLSKCLIVPIYLVQCIESEVNRMKKLNVYFALFMALVLFFGTAGMSFASVDSYAISSFMITKNDTNDADGEKSDSTSEKTS